MLLKRLQRAFEQAGNFVQFGMIFTMHLLYLVHQCEHFRTVATNAAMMDLQDVVNQQIRRPLLKIGRGSRLRLQVVERSCHTLGVSIGLAHCLQIVVGAVAAEVNAKMMEHVSRSKVVGYDFAYCS